MSVQCKEKKNPKPPFLLWLQLCSENKYKGMLLLSAPAKSSSDSKD